MSLKFCFLLGPCSWFKVEVNKYQVIKLVHEWFNECTKELNDSIVTNMSLDGIYIDLASKRKHHFPLPSKDKETTLDLLILVFLEDSDFRNWYFEVCGE